MTEPVAEAPEAPETSINDDVMRTDLALAREIGSAAAYDMFLERYADQSEAYPYQVAKQLRSALDPNATEPEAPTTKAAMCSPPYCTACVFRFLWVLLLSFLRWFLA